MRTRSIRTGLGATGAWILALCVACGLAAGFGAVRAADASAAGGAVIEERATPDDPRSFSPGGPVAVPDEAAGNLAPQVNCSSAVLLGGTGTSGNGRAPIANFRGIRNVYLITAAELAANGLPSGAAPSGIGWKYTTAPGVAASGTLTVYLQNTADTVFSKSTSFATATTGMTVVHNAATTLPNTTTAFDVPFVGGGAFTYTGGGLYVAFDWRYPVGTLGTGVIDCNTTLANGLESSQTTAAPPAPDLLTASAFRPLTRLTLSVNNDVSVDYVVSYGSLAKPLVGPQVVKAVVTNKGGNVQTNLPVTFNLTGAETFTDTKIVPTLAGCGGQTVVSFAAFTPSAIGSDTVTVSVPPDDVAPNNSKAKPLAETFNLYSYKHAGTTSDGGAGLTGADGAFVAKFTTTVAAKVSAVTIEFFAASATTYHVAIYPDSGSGTPGLVPIFEEGVDHTVGVAGPVTITLPTPVSVPAGNFFAGAKQTNTTNSSVAFDTEVPIRGGSFFFATPNPPAAWTDFAPGNNFKLNIGVTLIQCTTAAECNDNNACTDDACTNNLCTNTNNNSTSCDNNPCSDPDACVNGTCIPGPNPCNDNDACTIDLCAGGGGCTYQAVNCDDNNACTDDSCIPASGCAHSNNTGACSDGNPCTIGDVCSGGACVPGSAPLPTAVQFCNGNGIVINDGVAPTTASPYPSSITVSGLPSYLCNVTVNLNGITHSFPDDIDTMLEHLAGPSAIIMSDAGANAGASNVNLTLSDAAATSLGTTLVSGTFKPTNTVGGGTEAWPAPAPAPPVAPGSALSTFIGRNPNGAWNLWVVDDFAADAGTMAGWCVNVIAVCNVDADCNDNNPCTNDTCTNSACAHTNNTNPCNDNNACTANDTCTGGSCVGGPPPPCDDGNACTANNCNPVTALCENPPIVCNDNNACTDDSCDVGTGCVFTADDTNTCSDNSLCTTPDICLNGACVGQNPVVCPSDGNVCTTETCDPATGQCISTNNTNACDDGNQCTTGDICGPTFVENFDGETAPNLPLNWTSLVTGTGADWTTVNTSSDTAPNSAFGTDVPTVSDEVLISPPISITTASAKLTFRQRWSFESATSCFDAGVLEISIAAGPFTDVVTAGGSFVSGGYTGIVSAAFSNPLAGRSAWCNASAGYPGYVTTVVNLPAAAAGQTIQLQWRIGTDTSANAVGQNIDSIVVLDGANVCTPGSAVSCDDNNPCTDDSCDSILGCQHANNVDNCDDGSECTILDKCSGGACGGTTITCDDSNPCTLDSCSPATGCNFSPITAPPETQNVAADADKTTYTWSPAAFAIQYDVVRGSLAAFPVGPGGGDEVCFDNLAGTTLSDPATPAPDSGFWYLSRGENTCGNGTYGTQGFHGAPGAVRSSTTCP